MNYLLKKLLSSKKIVILLESNKAAAEFVSAILSKKFQVKILEEKKLSFVDLFLYDALVINGHSDAIKLAESPIIVFTKMEDSLKSILGTSFLIANADDKTALDFVASNNFRNITFGFNIKANVLVSDMHTNGGTNFKINYRGNTIPIWLPDISDESSISGALIAICVGITLGLNLVEISETIKSHCNRNKVSASSI